MTAARCVEPGGRLQAMDPRSARARMYARRRRTVGIVLFAAIIGGTVYAGLRADDRDGGDDKTATTQSPGSSGAPGAGNTGGAFRMPPTPHPIPGYLLIADRGNDRALLVGSGKKI